MLYCKVENGLVVNRAVFDGAIPSGWAEPGDVWIPSDAAQIGWAYGGGKFSEPKSAPEAIAIHVPVMVTLYQGRAALIGAGLFNQVKAAVEAQGQDSLAYQAFEYANHWYRDSPFIAQLAQGLGLSDSQIDALFLAAAEIK